MRISDCSSDVCSSDLGPIWCREGAHVRLAGIAAREIDNSCRPGQPCPRASGPAARDALVRLLGGPRGQTSTGHIRVAGPTMRCVSTGEAKGNRTGARSEEHTSELQSLMRISYAVFRLNKQKHAYQLPALDRKHTTLNDQY